MDHSVGCSLQVVQERRLAACGVASSFPQPFSWDLCPGESNAADPKWRKWQGCLGDEGMAKRQCPRITNNLDVLVLASGSCVLADSVSVCLVPMLVPKPSSALHRAHDDSDSVVDTD